MGATASTTSGGTGATGTSPGAGSTGATGATGTTATGATGTSPGAGATGATGGTAATGATGTSGTSNATTTAGAASTKTTKKEEPPSFLTSELYGILVGVFVTVLSIFVLFSTGSFLAVMVLWATILLIFIVLLFYDIIDIDTLLPYEPPKEDDTPQPSNAKLLGQTIGSEVFHVSDQQFVYDEARAVCAAYDSELATLEQIMEAFAGGAEWCSYGWSAGGMALYPTQKATWQLLQNEVDPGRRTRCGRPGVNGGYFDPSNKFGVNCFGFKPKGNFKPPAPVPGADTKKFNEMVKRFKNMMKAFTMDPYSRQEWSGYDSTGVKQAYEYGQKVVEGFMGRSSGYGLQFAQDLGGLVKEGMTNQNAYYEPIDSASSQKFPAQGPYGLRGDLGPTGPKGELGTAGPIGGVGPKGEQGIQGIQGIKGDKGDKGDKGAQGVPGTSGSTVGVVGPRGEKGEKGNPGERGLQGAQGPGGPAGPAGPAGSPASVPWNLNVGSIKVGNHVIEPRYDGTMDRLQIRRSDAGREDGIVFSTDDWANMAVSRGGGWRDFN